MKGVDDAREENKKKLAAIMGEAAPGPEDTDNPNPQDPPKQSEPPLDPAPAAASPQPGQSGEPAPDQPSIPDKPSHDDPELVEKLESSYGEIRRMYNREANARKLLEEQLQTLLIAQQAAQPMPATSPQGPAYAPELQTPTLDTVLKELEEDFDSDYLSQHQKLIQAVVRGEVENIRKTYDPLLSQFSNTIQNVQERTDQDAAAKWALDVEAQVPGFLEIAESNRFAAWVDHHPFGERFKTMLWPDVQRGEVGASAQEAVEIFKLFQSHAGQDTTPSQPVQNSQTPSPDNQQSQRRAAAAAAASTVPLPTSPASMPGQAPQMLRSDFNRRFNEVKNDMEGVRKLRQEMETAIAAGTWIDDTVPGVASY